MKAISTDTDIPLFDYLLVTAGDVASGTVCAGSSPDKLHHGSVTAEGERGGVDKAGQPYVWVKCKYCGDMFKGYASDLSAAYDDYVSTLPASGYNSSGNLSWRLNITSFTPNDYTTLLSSSGGSSFRVTFRGDGSIHDAVVSCYCSGFDAPIDGKYTLYGYFDWFSGGLRLGRSGIKYIFFCSDGPLAFTYKVGMVSDPSITFNAGSYLSGSTIIPDSSYFCLSNSSLISYSAVGYWELVCTPVSALSGDTYNINTRPTSITGGNYGIVGDNGQITKVEDNSTIVNETNNTYYNPATGQTVPITGWSYDYSDRSYKVTMEGGKTSTVTYGDENISITETTVNESGDTITNNYTIYYLIDGAGSETTPCEHTWSETSTTPATCTLSGSKLLTCSKCQQTKTETIPALGHDWQVKQTVTTQYDEEGNLTQQGYTIFECSRCHEQYKSPDGTIPPGGGSGTDPGGEDDGTTIGGLIEKLLSGVGSIVGGIIKGLLSLLTKAVEALAGLAELFTTFVGSLVELWGGFTSFLSAVFPFLPEEFVVIIELGLVLMIAAAVFRKFIS